MCCEWEELEERKYWKRKRQEVEKDGEEMKKSITKVHNSNSKKLIEQARFEAHEFAKITHHES